jgi:hypothetical protein
LVVKGALLLEKEEHRAQGVPPEHIPLHPGTLAVMVVVVVVNFCVLCLTVVLQWAWRGVAWGQNPW